MRAPRRQLIWLATLLAWATLGAGAALGVAVAAPIAVGWRSLAVLSGSMAPTLQTGDEIVVRPVAPVALRVGDVVTFNDPSRGHVLVTHRVRDVRVAGATVHVVTRGDANDGSERWSVAAGGRVGRVAYRLPKVGYVTVAAGGPLGRILLVVVPAILLGACEIWRVWRPRGGASSSASARSITGLPPTEERL
jgi:signal peptidase